MTNHHSSASSSTGSGHHHKLSSSLRDIMNHRPSGSATSTNKNESTTIQRHRQNPYLPITSTKSLRPTTNLLRPTTKPTNSAKARDLADRSVTVSTTCTSGSSSDAGSSHRFAIFSTGGINKSKELQDLVKVKTEEISYLKARLSSVEFENVKLASENMALKLTADQDKVVMKEKLLDATEQIRQHETMIHDFIKDVARLTLELNKAKAEVREQRAKVETMQDKLHKVVEDGSSFVQGLANQLNDEANVLHKDNSRRHHRDHQPWPRLTLDDADEKERLTTILDIAADHKFKDIVKPLSPIDSRSSSRSIINHHHRRLMEAPPLKEIEITTSMSKLEPQYSRKRDI